MNDNYGVPRDIFARIKIAGFYVLDIAVVIGSTLGAFVFGSNFFPTSQIVQLILFTVLTGIIALYLVLPFNGHKSNASSILLYIKRRKKRWTSSQK